MKKSLGAVTMPLPAPVWVIGSYDGQGRANVMTASWAGICCSRPPCVGVSLQKPRYTYANIAARRAFTVHVASAAQAKIVDWWGLASGRDCDKLARVGYTAVASELVEAPVVNELPVVMECRLVHQVELGSHTQFIGEVLDVKVEEALLGAGGRPDAEKLDTFVFMEGYRTIGPYLGLPFAIGREI
ncbi:MAG: flavin reductase family protein [Candidatus Latescibacterota bacterium]